MISGWLTLPWWHGVQQEGGRHGCRDEQAHETESWPGPELVGAVDDDGYLCAGHGWPVLLDVALDPCGEGGGDPGQHEHHGEPTTGHTAPGVITLTSDIERM